MTVKSQHLPKIPAVCFTTEDRFSHVTVLRHKISNKIFVQGRLVAQYKPILDEEGIEITTCPPLNAQGLIDGGQFRTSTSSCVYARNGTLLPHNPHLDYVDTLPYDDGMRLLHTGSVVVATPKKREFIEYGSR